MQKIFALLTIVLISPGCFPGSGEWDAGPMKVLGTAEQTLLQDAFSIDPTAHDLTLFLKGGKDFSLYAQWFSDVPLIDPDSNTDVFDKTADSTIPSGITPHAPGWWGASAYDYVVSAHDKHVYIGVLALDDKTFRYDAIRYEATVEMPSSVYQYFE